MYISFWVKTRKKIFEKWIFGFILKSVGFLLKGMSKSSVKTILAHCWSVGGFYQEQVDSYPLRLPAFYFYWLPCSRLRHYKSSLERQPVAERPCTRLHVCLVGVVAKSKSTQSEQFSRLLALSETADKPTHGHIHSLPSFLPECIFCHSLLHRLTSNEKA